MPAPSATSRTATVSLPPDRRRRDHRPGAGRWTCETDVIDVVLADDHDWVRAGLVALFDATPDVTVVGECADGDGLAELVERTHPRVALVDLKMPRVDGLEATRRALAVQPDLRVVLLTATFSPAHVREAQRLGAVGYRLKDDDPRAVLAAVRAAAAGRTAWTDAAADVLGVSHDASREIQGSMR
jgi:DNA-binding NarL/FixJ family response regulator